MANVQDEALESESAHRRPVLVLHKPDPAEERRRSLHGESPVDVRGPYLAFVVAVASALAGTGILYHFSRQPSLFLTGTACLLLAAALGRLAYESLLERLERTYREAGFSQPHAQQLARRQITKLCVPGTSLESAERMRQLPLDLD